MKDPLNTSNVKSENQSFKRIFNQEMKRNKSHEE